MVGLQKAMVGAVSLLFLLLSYNLLKNRPTQTSARVSQTHVPVHSQDTRLWGGDLHPLHPCWTNPTRLGARKPWGYVMVTCSHGPHYHRAQISDAVVVAQLLGATLVLPLIKEAHREPGSNFEDLYYVKHFIATLEGIVRIVGRLPDELKDINKTVVQVPYRVTQAYIQDKIRPVFEKNTIISIESFSPATPSGEKKEAVAEIEATRCLVTHRSLLFVQPIQRIGDRLLSRMREAAQSRNGHFIAVDLRFDMLQQNLCNISINGVQHKKRCLSPLELGLVLRSYGFLSDAAIYLTQSRLDKTLDALRSMFPNIFTKEYSMPFNEENQYLYSGDSQFEMAVDFYVCSHSDVFVSSAPGMFYTAVAAERIVAGHTQILAPTVKHRLSSRDWVLSLGISPFVTRREHPVYSCFCEKGTDVKSLSQGLESSGPHPLQNDQLSV
jgi:hypothetical protein